MRQIPILACFSAGRYCVGGMDRLNCVYVFTICAKCCADRSGPTDWFVRTEPVTDFGGDTDPVDCVSATVLG